jgi:hypothetical protein
MKIQVAFFVSRWIYSLLSILIFRFFLLLLASVGRGREERGLRAREYVEKTLRFQKCLHTRQEWDDDRVRTRASYPFVRLRLSWFSFCQMESWSTRRHHLLMSSGADTVYINWPMDFQIMGGEGKGGQHLVLRLWIKCSKITVVGWWNASEQNRVCVVIIKARSSKRRKQQDIFIWTYNTTIKYRNNNIKQRQTQKISIEWKLNPPTINGEIKKPEYTQTKTYVHHTPIYLGRRTSC